VLVTIDASEVHDLAADMQFGADNIPRRTAYIVDKVGHDMQATAQVLVPVDTGHLKSTITLTLEGLSFDLGPTAYYGGYVEEGTDGPYLIENAFGWGITVEHPGNSPEPYLGPAFDRHLPNMERALGALGVEAVMGMAA
jgi:hypothetical protein